MGLYDTKRAGLHDRQEMDAFGAMAGGLNRASTPMHTEMPGFNQGVRANVRGMARGQTVLEYGLRNQASEQERGHLRFLAQMAQRKDEAGFQRNMDLARLQRDDSRYADTRGDVDWARNLETEHYGDQREDVAFNQGLQTDAANLGRARYGMDAMKTYDAGGVDAALASGEVGGLQERAHVVDQRDLLGRQQEAATQKAERDALNLGAYSKAYEAAGGDVSGFGVDEDGYQTQASADFADQVAELKRENPKATRDEIVAMLAEGSRPTATDWNLADNPDRKALEERSRNLRMKDRLQKNYALKAGGVVDTLGSIFVGGRHGAPSTADELQQVEAELRTRGEGGGAGSSPSGPLMAARAAKTAAVAAPAVDTVAAAPVDATVGAGGRGGGLPKRGTSPAGAVEATSPAEAAPPSKGDGAEEAADTTDYAAIGRRALRAGRKNGVDGAGGALKKGQAKLSGKQMEEVGRLVVWARQNVNSKDFRQRRDAEAILANYGG